MTLTGGIGGAILSTMMTSNSAHWHRYNPTVNLVSTWRGETVDRDERIGAFSLCCKRQRPVPVGGGGLTFTSSLTCERKNCRETLSARGIQ
jgi:hypothetical protein